MKTRQILPIIFLALFISCTSEKGLDIQEVNSPASINSLYPNLFTDNTGVLFMSWLEKDEPIYHLKYSSFQKGIWTNPQTIASDSTWFINWADFPSVIAHNREPIAAHWLNKVSGGTYAYHVNMSLFDENDWGTPFTPHQDKSATEHGFVSMEPASDSTIIAAWLDGRKTEGRGDHEYLDLDKAMTLHAGIISTKKGIVNEFLVDDAICDCCNTSITKTDRGFIVAYRDRTENEIRDIYTASLTDGNWTEPKAVHNDGWKIAACPVNGPAIDAENNNVAVAWFTAANGSPSLKLAISDNYGDTYNEPVLLDDTNPIGRVDLSITNSKIWVSWLANGEASKNLEIRSLNFSGEIVDSLSVPGLEGGRRVGFPQISTSIDGIVIAYTDISDDQSKVRTMVLK